MQVQIVGNNLDLLHEDSGEVVDPMTAASSTGDQSLGHVLTAARHRPGRRRRHCHTYTGGLETAADLTADKVLEYTRRRATQHARRNPPRLWLTS